MVVYHNHIYSAPQSQYPFCSVVVDEINEWVLLHLEIYEKKKGKRIYFTDLFDMIGGIKLYKSHHFCHTRRVHTMNAIHCY